MAKTSGGVRKGGKASVPRIVGFKESEKAIQIEMRWSAEYYYSSNKFGGYTSSMIQSKDGVTKIWVPKSQIEQGRLSNWIADQKTGEIEKILHYPDMITKGAKFFDATGRRIEVGTQRDVQRWERYVQNRQNALSAAKSRRESLVEQAKRNGYRAHMRMKTKTLEAMAAGTYKR